MHAEIELICSHMVSSDFIVHTNTHTQLPTLFTTQPWGNSLLRASSNYSHLVVTSAPACSCFRCHRQKMEKDRVNEEREKGSRACSRTPLGNSIMHYYTDSSGKWSAPQHCSSSSSGHPGRLWAIIGPDLWDDGGLTHQCLLNSGVNMPKDPSSRKPQKLYLWLLLHFEVNAQDEDRYMLHLGLCIFLQRQDAKELNKLQQLWPGVGNKSCNHTSSYLAPHHSLQPFSVFYSRWSALEGEVWLSLSSESLLPSSRM